MSPEEQIAWCWKYNAKVDFGNTWVTITEVIVRQTSPNFLVIPITLYQSGGFSLAEVVGKANLEITAYLKLRGTRY